MKGITGVIMVTGRGRKERSRRGKRATTFGGLAITLLVQGGGKMKDIHALAIGFRMSVREPPHPQIPLPRWGRGEPNIFSFPAWVEGNLARGIYLCFAALPPGL